MGIDYKKKYLKYKNKYLEAKKIYGGSYLKDEINSLVTDIQTLKNMNVGENLDNLIDKCRKCENPEQVAALREQVEDLKKKYI